MSPACGDTGIMKKTAHPRNHEDGKVEKLLERIARKKSAKRPDENINEAPARTVIVSPVVGCVRCKASQNTGSAEPDCTKPKDVNRNN